MDGKTLETLGDLVAQTEKQREILRLLAAKKWTESEIRDLIANAEGSPDLARVLGAIRDAVDLAKREGRYVDDVTATRANVLKRIPKGSWTLSSGEVGALFLFADSLDRAERDLRAEMVRAATASGAPGAPARAWETGSHAVSFTGAARAIVSTLADAGALSEERHLGYVASETLPPWTRSGHLDLVEVAAAPPAMVREQAARWSAMEGAWRVLLAAVRAGEPWPPYNPGASWEPWSSDFVPPSPSYSRVTRGAQDATDAYFFRLRKQAEKAAADAARDAFRRTYGEGAAAAAAPFNYPGSDR